MKCYNPVAFRPMSVTAVLAVVYLALVIPLIVIHETVPAAPSNPTLYRGLNQTEAWLDLLQLTDGYHPFNSRRNDEVRNWLLTRIDSILESNGVSYSSESVGPLPESIPSEVNTGSIAAKDGGPQIPPHPVVVFNDLVANYTSTALTKIGASGRKLGISTYFEGNNIIVYIRGTEDADGEWWQPLYPPYGRHDYGKGGVMINAHFDSVSTGYGATDDGVGVITALQLIRYFTTEGNTPKKGVIALFNNGEEDGLYGAKAFLSHPMAKFVHTFLNLEGAGAGGRAMLFRSTDTEVTRAYAKAKHPLGSVVSSDGYSLGFVRSETDYVVFRAEGYRGLDVAFWEPRARYHTDQDDARHTSKDSLWHMLSASVETMKYLTADTREFVGDRGDNTHGKVKNGRGTTGVWFDLFGSTMAVFGLRTLFAWSLTLLIVSPLILMIITFFLIQNDKYYLFAGTVKPAGHESEVVSLQGWRGFFRFPIVVVVSSAVTFGAAFLLRKANPMIVYSSQYSVWVMQLCLFFSVFWFLMAGCNAVRPSALHRTYALIWMFAVGWVVLVAATVYEDRFKISGGYLFVFYEFGVFLAVVIGLCELFALPTKKSVVESTHDAHETRDALAAIPSPAGLVPANDGSTDHVEPDEETSLLGGNSHRSSIGTTFVRGYRRLIPSQHDGANDHAESKHKAFGEEQQWSGTLPTWTWLPQFLMVGPFTIIIVGQVGLLLVTALNQTGTDGGPLLLPYLVLTFFSILLLLPVTPFIHRLGPHIPTFFFLLFIGTLIYNLIAFPFSQNNRYKAYFQQTVDLDSGVNQVTISGLEEHVRDIISYIPSAAGQPIKCTKNPAVRDGIDFCSYTGIPPKVVNNVLDGVPPEKGYRDWLTYNVTRTPGENKATFQLSGRATKACILRFDEPFTAFHVAGAASGDGRWPDVPESGSDQIKLWHRDWEREWVVDVEWPVGEGKQKGEEGRSGRVVCLWSDHNNLGTIPALDEVYRYMPAWTSVVKAMDGLVEGSKAFVV